MDKILFETGNAYNPHSLKANTPIMIIENEEGVFLLDLDRQGYLLEKFKMWENGIQIRFYIKPFTSNSVHYIIYKNKTGNLYQELKKKGINEIPPIIL